MRFSKKTLFLIGILSLSILPTMQPQNASAAACGIPSTDYGQVTGISISAPTAATYRIWTRMSVPNTVNNTYLVEIDGMTCYNVGGSGIPTYNPGALTFFANSTAHWTNKTSAGATVSLALTAGTHSLKLIGNAPGVVVDRVLLTTSTTCLPNGTGSNCTDASAPVISAMQSTSVTQNSASVSWTTNEPSTTRVEYGLTTSYGQVTALVSQLTTSHTASLTSLAAGTLYHYRVLSIDEAGNLTSSGDSTFMTSSTPAYAAADINQDGVTGLLDVSLLAANWGRSGAGIGRSDINGDGVVNALDLSLLIANYGK